MKKSKVNRIGVLAMILIIIGGSVAMALTEVHGWGWMLFAGVMLAVFTD